MSLTNEPNALSPARYITRKVKLTATPPLAAPSVGNGVFIAFSFYEGSLNIKRPERGGGFTAKPGAEAEVAGLQGNL